MTSLHVMPHHGRVGVDRSYCVLSKHCWEHSNCQQLHEIVLNSWTFSAPIYADLFVAAIWQSFSGSLHFVSLGLCSWGSDSKWKTRQKFLSKDKPRHHYTLARISIGLLTGPFVSVSSCSSSLSDGNLSMRRKWIHMKMLIHIMMREQ